MTAWHDPGSDAWRTRGGRCKLQVGDPVKPPPLSEPQLLITSNASIQTIHSHYLPSLTIGVSTALLSTLYTVTTPSPSYKHPSSNSLSASSISCCCCLVNMANVQDQSVTGSATEEHGHGAGRTDFLDKLKATLHIGHKHEEKVAASEETPAPTPASATPVAKAVDDVVAPPPVPTSTVAPSEHHGGVPTFLAALPDQDVPAVDAPAHSAGLHHVESEQAKQGEHQHGVPEGGMPTFLAALPEQDVPAEDAPGHPGLHHVAPDVDSKEVQQGEHYQGVPDGGVPTFLAALPDQDIPAEDTPAHNELHHVQQGEHQPGGAPHFDSEQVFEQAQQGEHHHGVPTFLVALPDQEIPDEVNREASEVTAPEHHEPHHGHSGEQFDSEQVFQDAQQGEHHHGVPTFLVALPDQEIPNEVTKGIESTHDAPAADDSLTEGSLLK